jgi:hypothetical protein
MYIFGRFLYKLLLRTCDKIGGFITYQKRYVVPGNMSDKYIAFFVIF